MSVQLNCTQILAVWVISLLLPTATLLGNLSSLESCFEPPRVQVLSVKCETEDSQNVHVMADFRAKPQGRVRDHWVPFVLIMGAQSHPMKREQHVMWRQGVPKNFFKLFLWFKQNTVNFQKHFEIQLRCSATITLSVCISNFNWRLQGNRQMTGLKSIKSSLRSSRNVYL